MKVNEPAHIKMDALLNLLGYTVHPSSKFRPGAVSNNARLIIAVLSLMHSLPRYSRSSGASHLGLELEAPGVKFQHTIAPSKMAPGRLSIRGSAALS